MMSNDRRQRLVGMVCGQCDCTDAEIEAAAEELRADGYDPRQLEWYLADTRAHRRQMQYDDVSNNAFLELRGKTERAVDEWMRVLTRKYHESVNVDDYGNKLSYKYQRQIGYFIDNVLLKSLNETERKAVQVASIRARVTTLIYDLVEAEIAKSRGTDTFGYYPDDMSGEEFERFCAEQLRREGWQTRLTKASGDQGTDIVAEKDKVRVVLQCKRSSKPVGNKAVQEATAARLYQSADVACVVSNAEFTPAARELAGATNVHLLHYLDLRSLETIVPPRPHSRCTTSTSIKIQRGKAPI